MAEIRDAQDPQPGCTDRVCVLPVGVASQDLVVDLEETRRVFPLKVRISQSIQCSDLCWDLFVTQSRQVETPPTASGALTVWYTRGKMGRTLVLCVVQSRYLPECDGYLNAVSLLFEKHPQQ